MHFQKDHWGHFQIVRGNDVRLLSRLSCSRARRSRRALFRSMRWRLDNQLRLRVLRIIDGNHFYAASEFHRFADHDSHLHDLLFAAPVQSRLQMRLNSYNRCQPIHRVCSPKLQPMHDWRTLKYLAESDKHRHGCAQARPDRAPATV